MAIEGAAWYHADRISQTIINGTNFETAKSAVIGIAAAFVLWNWYIAYKDLAIKPDGKQAGLTVWKLIEGVIMITVVASCYQILELLDGLMVDFGNALTQDTSLTVNMDDVYSNLNGTDEDTPLMEQLNPLTWLYEGIRWLVNIFIIVIDFGYFLTRGFLLFFLKFVAPLVLALGVIESQRHLVMKFFRHYLSVYLIGFGYILAIYFTNSAWTGLAEYFGGGWAQFLGVDGPIDIAVLFVILLAKKLMFTEVNNLAKSILS